MRKRRLYAQKPPPWDHSTWSNCEEFVDRMTRLFAFQYSAEAADRSLADKMPTGRVPYNNKNRAQTREFLKSRFKTR